MTIMLIVARAQCAQEFSYFLENLKTYTQILPTSACTGSQAPYDEVPEQYGSRFIFDSFGSYLHDASFLHGRWVVLSQDSEGFAIISWRWGHSGWKLLDVKSSRSYMTTFDTNA
jgi:nuclear pore complex protein Nup188